MVDLTSTSATSTAEDMVISSGHQDYILATALDTYGRRLATCSGDRCVKVWEYGDGTWKEAHSWQAHLSAVTDVAWAHPEFGTLLATASADHSCKIWQEEGRVSYTVKATFTEARRATSCIAFAPRHLGLKVATGSADGCLRIYEAVDVANLSQWPLAATLNGTALLSASASSTTTGSINAVSWCTGRFDAPTLATASTVGCVLYRYVESARNWQAVLQVHGGGCLDVAWAPNVGRRHHALAMATAAGGLRVCKLERSTLTLEETQEVEDAGVWKCQWNVTGTVLATTGDAGLLQLYKKGPSGKYSVVSKIVGDVQKIANAH